MIADASDDAWAALAAPFVEGAYATVNGQVRTHVLHQHLLAHVRKPPATLLDVGGGADYQSLPLARLRFEVTILDPSAAMLAKAEKRPCAEPDAVRRRTRLIEGAGESAVEALGAE